MKRKPFNSKGIFVYALVVFMAAFTGCSDEDENFIKIYPEGKDAEAFDINNVTGRLSGSGNTWYLWIDKEESSDILDKSFGEESGPTIEITNMNESYKKMAGKVRVSGTIQLQYITKPKDTNMPLLDYHYTLKVKNMESIEDIDSRTRAIGEPTDSLECGTIATGEPSWLFAKSANGAFDFHTYQFRVFVHIIRSSDGNGFSNTICQTVINNLNDYYDGNI